MRIKYLIVLALIVLLAAACGPQMATPTPRVTSGSTVEEATPVAVEEVPPATGEAITATLPVTPTGGVEVALAAIEPMEAVLATVNGQEITWTDYEPELRRTLYSVTQQYGVDWNEAANLALLGTLQDQVLQTVVDRTLLRQGAAEEGIQLSQADLEARLEEEKTAILESGQYSSWDEFKELLGVDDEYFSRLLADAELVNLVSEAYGPEREAEQVHARHILVADEETGEQVLTRLEAGEDWAQLAAEYSQDTSNKDNAGDLGWFPRGAMVAPFEEVAFSLEPGETSGLVETDFGYHIIQVLEKGMQELDDQMYSSLLQRAFQTWFEEQQAAADTVIIVQFVSEE